MAADEQLPPESEEDIDFQAELDGLIDEALTREVDEELAGKIHDAAVGAMRANATFSWDLRTPDIQYLIDRCPFLQIVDTKVVTDPPPEPEFTTLKSGWTLYDYGNALSCSPGLYLYAGGDFRMRVAGEEDDGDEGAIINPGKGTLINQIYETAIEMVEIADDRAWEGLLIVDGQELMKWAAWVEAYDRGFHIYGYEPGDKAFAKRRRIRRTVKEEEEIRRVIQRRMGLSR